MKFALAALAAFSLASAAHADGPRVAWTVEQAQDPDRAQLNLSWHSTPRDSNSGSRGIDLAQLAGLSRAQLNSTSLVVVRFRLTRDAGALDCEGSAKAGLGSGACDFRASEAFARQLSQSGAGTASREQLLNLAVADIGAAYLEELRRQRYATASVADLVQAGQHGADLRFLQGMGALGYHVQTLPALVRMVDHGANPAYVEALARQGYRNLPADTVVQMRDHGVTPSFVADLHALGYAALAPEMLVRLRDHGVSAQFVSDLRALGYPGLEPDTLVRLRDHGVTAEFVRRVSTPRKLDVDELIRTRDTGGR